MSIMEKIFGRKPEPVSAQLGSTNPALSQTGQQQQSTAPNSTLEAKPAAELSPLAPFADLWQTDPNAKPNTPQPLISIDPAKIQEAAARNDFTKIITPEMKAALAQGGDQAIAATLALINLTGQKAFADSAMATGKIVESALQKQSDQFKEMLPGIIKQHQVSENLSSSNPLFSNPAVAPILELMKNQVALKHPTATAKEQQDMAMQYVSSLSAAFAPPTPQAVAAKKNDTDWGSFIEGN